jgi:hypothetical protein
MHWYQKLFLKIKKIYYFNIFLNKKYFKNNYRNKFFKCTEHGKFYLVDVNFGVGPIW